MKDKIHHPSIGRLIGMISHHAHAYFKHEFKNLPIGHAQVFTLHHLIHNDGISQKQLTKYAKLDKGSIASQLQYLEKNGYIVRKASKEDARVLNIFITEKSKKIENEIHSIFRNWSRTLLSGFDEEEEKIVYETLCKLSQNAQKKIEEIKFEKKKSNRR